MKITRNNYYKKMYFIWFYNYLTYIFCSRRRHICLIITIIKTSFSEKELLIPYDNKLNLNYCIILTLISCL